MWLLQPITSLLEAECEEAGGGPWTPCYRSILRGEGSNFSMISYFMRNLQKKKNLHQNCCIFHAAFPVDYGQNCSILTHVHLHLYSSKVETSSHRPLTTYHSYDTLECTLKLALHVTYCSCWPNACSPHSYLSLPPIHLHVWTWMYSGWSEGSKSLPDTSDSSLRTIGTN